MSTYVTLDFIKCLREAQINLYKEDSMNEVESITVKSQTNLIISLFNQSRINQKKFFLLINKIISPTMLSDSLSSINSHKDPNQIIPSPIPSAPLMNIVRFVITFQDINPVRSEKRKIEDQKRFFSDLLTFSIIPSYFNFFWTEYSIKSFFKFFSCLKKSVSEEFYDNLARIGFCTPFSLRFSQFCFQSAFSELLSPTTNIRNIDKKTLIQKIRCNVKKYQNFIPDEMLVVLACSSDPLRTLINSFFTIALSSPIASQAFGFFHFSSKPTKEALNFLKTMFDIKHKNTHVMDIMDAIINCDYQLKSNNTKTSRYKELVNMYSDLFKDSTNFDEKIDEQQELNEYQITMSDNNSNSLDNSSIILECIAEDSPTKRKEPHIESTPVDLFQNDEISFESIEPIPNTFKLFSHSDIYNAQEIFQTKLLNSLDTELIKYITGKSPKFCLPQSIDFYCDSKARPTKFSKVNIDEHTILNQAYLIAPMIRHILQKADMIPIFKKAPPNMTVQNFLYTFLVRRGDISYLSERMNNFDQMMTFFPNQSIKAKIIQDALSCTTFTRMKKIKALSTFASIELKLNYLDMSSQKQITSTQIVKEVNEKIFTQFKSMRTPFEYTKSPNLFVADYKSAINRFSEIPEFAFIQHPQKTVFAVLAEKIDLYTFASQRERLKKSLKEYDELFSKESSSHLLSFIKENFPRTKKPQPLPNQNSPKSKTSEFDKNHYIMTKIMRVGIEKRDIIETMTEAFVEPSLMRKVDLISLALTNFQLFLENDYPPNKGKLGSDEFTPAFAALIIFINPPMLVTNYVYLHDMTTGDLPTTQIFGGYVSTIPIYLNIAAERVIPELVDKPPFLLHDEDE